MVNICKASAGSGKTTKLAINYIIQLFKSDDAYRHILAVTFTNKATAEMKERIITYLYQLSKGTADKNVYSEIDKGLPETPESVDRAKYIRERSGIILNTILHDYSAFAVSTIDSFFQRTMRSFARELGQYASYNIQLDHIVLVDKGIDRMLDSLDDEGNTDLLEWLYLMTVESLREGESWNFRKKLPKLCKDFFKEDFRTKKREFEGSETFNDKNFIRNFKQQLANIQEQYENEVKQIAGKALKVINAHGLTPDSFKSASNTMKRLLPLAERKIPESLPATFINLQDNVENWYRKTDKAPQRAAIEECYHDGLNDLVKEMISKLADQQKYRTAASISRKLYSIGIFSDIYNSMHECMREENTILLEETSDLLSRLIGDDDAPFVYEKIGTRFDNYMLDEFQDTSLLQWENFRPLMVESTANNNENLIVGDTKQSIYRWRSSDWRLFENQIETQFRPDDIKTEPLKKNWRSASEIIDFNNELYSQAAPLVQHACNENTGNAAATDIVDIYRDVQQEKGNPEHHGHVRVEFARGISEDYSFKAEAVKRLGETVTSLMECHGYRAKDIMVLSRAKEDLALVAQKLISMGIDVITADSLNLDKCRTVNRIISVLRNDLNPEDSMTQAIARLFSVEQLSSPGSSTLYERCEYIIGRCIGTENIPAGDIPYLNLFLDNVLDYMSHNGSDLRGFLNWWDESGRSTSVEIPEGQDAVRLFTVHKAKGLAAKVVIVPFFDTKLEGSGNVLWLSTKGTDFEQIGIVPLKSGSKEINGTIFEPESKQEQMMTYIDMFNIAYVATTRARDEMIILAPRPEDPDAMKTWADFLFCSFRDRFTEDFDKADEEADRLAEQCAQAARNGEQVEMPVVCWSATDFGQWTDNRKEPDVQESEEMVIDSYRSVDPGDRFRISLRGVDFFKTAARIKGIVLHDILAHIETAQDIDTAVAERESEAEIAAGSVEKVKSKITELLGDVAARHWFDGTYQVLNETSLIGSTGVVTRPDRTLIDRGDDRHAIVIDYKFGIEHTQYIAQVEGYMQSLRDMGYTRVEGYLWYAEKREVVPVLV